MAELIAEGMIPLYRQVADRIQSDIINASDDPSRPIPSELMPVSYTHLSRRQTPGARPSRTH